MKDQSALPAFVDLNLTLGLATLPPFPTPHPVGPLRLLGPTGAHPLDSRDRPRGVERSVEIAGPRVPSIVRSGLEEGQQVGVELVLVRVGQTVGAARIDLQRRVLKEYFYLSHSGSAFASSASLAILFNISLASLI